MVDSRLTILGGYKRKARKNRALAEWGKSPGDIEHGKMWGPEVFISNTSLQKSQAFETSGKAWTKEEMFQHDQVKEYLNWTYINARIWCTRDCWGSWQISLLGHSPQSLINHGIGKKCMKAEWKQRRFLYTRRARWRT